MRSTRPRSARNWAGNPPGTWTAACVKLSAGTWNTRIGSRASRARASLPRVQPMCSYLRDTTLKSAMPSFDIVSQVNSMEIENAVNAARKELANRFDFKGSKSEIALDKNEIKLSAEDQFKMKALTEIVFGKLAKRNISLKSVETKDPEISPLGHARQVIRIKQGIEAPVAKQL